MQFSPVCTHDVRAADATRVRLVRGVRWPETPVPARLPRSAVSGEDLVSLGLDNCGTLPERWRARIPVTSVPVIADVVEP